MTDDPTRRLRSRLDSADRIGERMDAIRLKELLDPGSLTERERMCLQIERNGFGCNRHRR
jgi:hypothetical protein